MAVANGEEEIQNLTAELSSRQGDLHEGDIVVVKLRDNPGWVKLQLTSGRIKGHKGRWFNYKNLSPDLGGDLEGSVNLLPQGRWYIFSSEEDDKIIAPLITQDEELVETQLEAEKTHISNTPTEFSDADGDIDPLGINKLIDEIRGLGSSSPAHEVSTPELNEEIYEQYCNLEHDCTPTDLFQNEVFDYRISGDKEQLGTLFDPSISALKDARILYHQMKELFATLHQSRVPDASRILQALKLSSICLKRIKTSLRNLNQKMIDSESIPREVQSRFEEDASDQCKVLQTYIEVCVVISSEPPGSQHSASGNVSTKLNSHKKVSGRKQTNGLFIEIDRAAQTIKDINEKSKNRRAQYKTEDAGAEVNSTMRSGRSMLPHIPGERPNSHQLRRSLEQTEEMHDDRSSSYSSNSSSDFESELELVSHRGEPSCRGAISSQLSEADLKTMSRMEQSLTEMKERTVKVLRNNVKSSQEIREMDENSLLTMSKYGPSTWASAIEKLDSSRYTTTGCLNSLKLKLSARKVGKIKETLRAARHASARASDCMEQVREEVTRRNISTIPVSQEVSKCAVIGKFSGTSIPHVFTWVRDIEQAIRQLKIPLTLQGNFIKKYLEGEAMSRVELEIPRSKINPSKDDVFSVLKKYYGRPFIIMKQLAERHKDIKQIPSQDPGKDQGKTSKSCMEHLKVIRAAEELATEVGNNLSTIYDEYYLQTLKSILPWEYKRGLIDLVSADQETRFRTIKLSITQLEQTSSQCSIEESSEKQVKDTPPPKVLLVDNPSKKNATDRFCFHCLSTGHMANACTSTKCSKCGGDIHKQGSCPQAERWQTRPDPPFAPGTQSGTTTCKICKAAAKQDGKEAVPALHGLTKGGWVEPETCPLIKNLDVTAKADFLDKITVCKSCLRAYTHTTFHPGPTCELKNLWQFKCSSDECMLRVTTCKEHLPQNRAKLERLKVIYSMRDQAICFLSSCDNWRQEIMSLRSNLHMNLEYMKEGVETLSQPNVLLTMNNPNLPYLCSDPSELPKLTSKPVRSEKEGTPTFLVFKLQGEDGSALSVMFDTGASFSLFRTDVMGRSLIASRVQDDRPDVVAGIGGLRQVENWKCLLPLAEDSSYQVVSAQSVDSIISVKAVDLKPSLRYIKKIHSPALDAIQIQDLEDTDISGLIGVKSSALQPKLITMTSLGVGLYKICLKAANNEPQYALGGNIPTLNEIYRELGKEFIDDAFQEVERGLNGFYDMRSNLLVTSEEIQYQERARKSLLETGALENNILTCPQDENLVSANEPRSRIESLHVCGPKCIRGHKFDVEHATYITDVSQSTQVMLTDCSSSSLNELQGEVHGSISKQILKGLIGVNSAIEDNYRCINCLGCKSCKTSMKVEMNSAKIEEEVARLRECVRIDDERHQIICKLPLKKGDENLLAPNFRAAKDRLRTELLKLRKLPEEEQHQVRDSFLKLRKLGYIKTLSELSEDEKRVVTASKVNYFIPVSIAYKESSVSTPARITMDASSRTSSSYSLNSLLPVGSNSFNIAKLIQAWRLGRIGFFSDISKFYNSFSLEAEFWPLQQMLWEESLDPDLPPTSYYIVTLIYGVSCVAGLTEIGLEKLEDKFPDELRPILFYRYIDDLARSFESLPEALKVTSDALEKLKSYGLKSKGTVFTSVEAPEEMKSHDGTVQVIGHTWDTITDEFQLRIPQIILGKKSKAKGKTTFLKVFKGSSLQELDRFIPEELSLRMMLSLTASIWDVSGQMSPLTGMLWHCVRRACLDGRDYDKAVSDKLREDFIARLWEVQLLKNFKYPRTQISSTAKVRDGTLFCFSDAGLDFEQSICYASFKGESGTWTCQFMQSKNILVHVNRSIPNAELNAAATTSRMASAVSKNNPGVFTRSILCVDSTTVLFWATDLTSRFDVFRRSRTQTIRQTFNSLYFVRSSLNPADTGTRSSVRAEDISPNSRFFCGPGYVTLGEERCIKEGLLTPAEKLTAKQDAPETPPAESLNQDANFIGVVTRSQQAKRRLGSQSTRDVPELCEGLANPSAGKTLDKRDITLQDVQHRVHGEDHDFRKEVLDTIKSEDYLICPLRHGLVKSVKGTALVFKYIVNLGTKILNHGGCSITLEHKLRNVNLKITGMARANSFPAVFVSQSNPSDPAEPSRSSDMSRSYGFHTLNTSQVILTYPGITKARKNLERSRILLSSSSNDWTRPLNKEQHNQLVQVGVGLKSTISLLKALHRSWAVGLLGGRGVAVLAFLSKLSQGCTSGIKIFKNFHEMADTVALINSDEVKNLFKNRPTREMVTQADCTASSFISLMGSQEQATTFSDAATCHMVRVAQAEIRTKWAESKQARHGFWRDSLLISHHRWRDATEALNDLGSGGLDTTFLAGFQINTSAPVLPRSSALYLSLACHIHVNVSGVKAIQSTSSFTHRSARMDYLVSLHFAYAPGGNLVFQRIKDSCMDCHKKNKKPMSVKFGPLAHKMLNLVTPFSISAVDLVGPFLVKQMPHSRATRNNSGLTKAYVVVFVCRVTHLTWGEVCESRKTPDVCSAFSRFASIWGAPKHVTTDSEGSLQKILKEATFLTSVEDRLYKQLGIKVTTVPVSHHQRNPAEPRCRSMQHLIKGADLEKHGVTIFGLQDITYLAATLTNSIPFGVSLRNANGASSRVFSPLSFLKRGMTKERRTLMGPILIPTSLAAYFTSIDEHYKQMLNLYHTVVLPSMMTPSVFTERRGSQGKLSVDDIVYFKKRPQDTISPSWSLGRVVEVEKSSDEEVRVVKLVYYGVGVSDELQESVSNLHLEEDASAPLAGEGGISARMHHTIRDAREVVKLPVIDDDLQDHFTALSHSYAESHEPSSAMTILTSEESRVMYQHDFPSLISNACLMQSGIRYLRHSSVN